jgi:hypothetical protein
VDNLRLSRSGKKAFKVLLSGCLIIITLFVILLVVAVILTLKYHTQLYEGFLRIINYIFGDSPDNVIRGYIQLFADNYLKGLFSGN